MTRPADDTPSGPVGVTPEAYGSPEAERLVAALMDDVERRYAGIDPDLGPPTPPPDARPAPRALPHRDPGWVVTAEQVTPPVGLFVVARLGGDAVGCGAVRRLPGGEPTIGELKRIHVEPAARRRGVARAVLAALVGAAPGFGFERLVLETGEQQPEALALYEREGWYPVEPYGEFGGSVDSRCFGLDLRP